MVDFGGLADKAKGLISEHSEQVKDGVEKAGGFVGNKIGHDKVDPIEDKIDGFVDQIAREKAAEPQPKPGTGSPS